MFKLYLKNIFTVLTFLLPSHCFAQGRYLDGYILKDNGDKLKGFVLIGEIDANPTSVRFKPDRDAKPLIFDINNCRGFGIDQMEDYERHAVKLSLGEVKYSGIKGGIDTTWVPRTIFLKVLQKGENVNLYQYTDDIKTRFYIADASSNSPEELMYYRYMTGKERVYTTNNMYRNQLVAWFRKYGVEEKNDQWLRNANYNQSDMSKSISIINKGTGQEIKKAYDSKYPKASFYLGLGVLTSKLELKGSPNILTGASAVLKGKVSPYFVIGADIYANPLYRKLFYRPELGVSINDNSITADFEWQNSIETYTYQFKQLNVSFTHLIGYNLLSQPKYSVYLCALFGVYYGFNTMSSYTMYDNNKNVETIIAEPIFKKLSWDAAVTLGGRITKKIELTVSYGLPTLLTTNDARYSFFRSRIRGGINYHF